MYPMANRVKVWKYSEGLTTETNNFAFKAKFILGLKSTRPDGWMGRWMVGGWVAGWISWKYSHLSPARAGALDEFGKNKCEFDVLLLYNFKCCYISNISSLIFWLYFHSVQQPNLWHTRKVVLLGCQMSMTIIKEELICRLVTCLDLVV